MNGIVFHQLFWASWNRLCFLSKLKWLGKSPGKLILCYPAETTEFSAVVEGSFIHQNWSTKYLILFFVLYLYNTRRHHNMEVPCTNIHPILRTADNPEQENNGWMVMININKSLPLCWTNCYSRRTFPKVPIVLTTIALKFM